MKQTTSMPILMSMVGVLVSMSGCMSGNSARRPGVMVINATARTELVLLNATEASGWVAYRCETDDTKELEEYRVVVLRSNTNELIYDSTVLLAANLCTHGFEMDANDPRLRRMAESVDRNVIAPLEQFQSGSESRGDSQAPVAVEPAPTKAAVAPANVDVVLITDSVDEKSIHFHMVREGLVQIGSRLFVRSPDREIQLPGLSEKVISRGEISGLVEVSAVEGLRASATLVSGTLPENAVLEIPVSE